MHKKIKDMHFDKNSIRLIKPDDWHCHFRENDSLLRTVPDAAQRFCRAIAMPNLATPITTLEQADNYKKSIIAQVPAQLNFTPLMTLYLTEHMPPDTIIEGKKSELITACKLYPAGATTGSESGIQSLEKIYPLLDAMQSVGMHLCIHGETIDPTHDIFDREKRFLMALKKIIENFPTLKITLEHISTKAAVEFVTQQNENLAATITPQHLLYNRNDIFHKGIRPHYYCLPILKRAEDQQALIQAATSGNAKFFLGTDSAPHTKDKKENACGCAGIYSSHAALEIYAEIFEAHDALEKFENFASVFGAEFYELPQNTQEITLTKNPWVIPNTLTFGNEPLIPMKAGETVSWQIKNR